MKMTGFTLAEVLITLGIIGIIAAMVIPQIFGKISTIKNTAILRQDYAILSHAMKMALDQGKLTTFQGNANDMKVMRAWFDDAILPNIKAVTTCYDEPGCWAGTEKTLSGEKGDTAGSNRGCGQKTITFILPNGSAVCIDDFYGDTLWERFGIKTGSMDEQAPNVVFYIDVNNTDPPNVYGRDIFILVYNPEDDSLVTAGADKSTDDINLDCSWQGTGRYCATYAKRNGWRLPSF